MDEVSNEVGPVMGARWTPADGPVEIQAKLAAEREAMMNAHQVPREEIEKRMKMEAERTLNRIAFKLLSICQEFGYQRGMSSDVDALLNRIQKMAKRYL